MSNAHGSSIEELYNQYLEENSSVEYGWQKFFEGFEFARTNFEDHGVIPENMNKEFKVIQLINGYRNRGHLFTKTNPVRERRKYKPDLSLENFGLSQVDLKTSFNAGEEVGLGAATLQEIVDHLEETYCQSIGVEFTYVRHPDRVDWLKNKIELKN